MVRKINIILVFLFLTCLNCPAQTLTSTSDGVHKEFYENGKLKLEYVTKAEQFNGYYEKYDKDGALEYREYYVDGIFDGVDHEHFHYELFSWYRHFADMPHEILLNEQEAKEKFLRGYELADNVQPGNWMGIVRTRIPTGTYPEKAHPVTLTGISRNYIYLKEYEDRTDIVPRKHHYCKLIQKYKVQRGEDVDSLFNVSLIEDVFKRRYAGVEYGTPYGNQRRREGSRLRSVQQYLGNPDYTRPLKPAGWFDVYYEWENLHIIGHSSAVYFMEEGKPDWVGAKNGEEQ